MSMIIANKKLNTKILSVALIAFVLLIILCVQVMNAPTFILPPIYMTGIIILGLLVTSGIISGIVKLIFKRFSFLLLFCVLISVGALIGIIKFYHPTLTVTVPKGYVGQVTLVLSNVKDNELTIDENGIGYITEYTFEKTYSEPIVLESDGSNINDRCVGFNPTTFWAKGKFTTSENNKTIQFKSFEIVSEDKIGQKQYYTSDLSKNVDLSKVD